MIHKNSSDLQAFSIQKIKQKEWKFYGRFSSNSGRDITLSKISSEEGISVMDIVVE
jgi:hypothetical protein